MRYPRLFSLTLGLAVAAGLSFAAIDDAHADKEPKNLKVLDAALGKKIGKGMKGLSKGLGVKCLHCHVKGKMESDDVQAKLDTRDFLKAVLTSKDEAANKAALAALLKKIKIDAAKDEKKVWEGIGMWKK